MKKILIIIPTYNEKQNIIILVKRIFKALKKNFDILFIDDNSPDGTKFEINKIQKRKKNIKLISRNYKKGIGSAHKLGIKWGYKKKYPIIITMDCDGTHNPIFIKKMIAKLKVSDLVITNRFLNKNSLNDWPFHRKFLTYIRHYLFIFFFNITYDSSGAFRVYNTRKIKYKDVQLAKNDGYSFFWESIFILVKKKYKISDIPIKLPNRVTGSSKMKLTDVFFTLYYLVNISLKNFFGKI
mgnify:CR=1 FL=1